MFTVVAVFTAVAVFTVVAAVAFVVSAICSNKRNCLEFQCRLDSVGIRYQILIVVTKGVMDTEAGSCLDALGRRNTNRCILNQRVQHYTAPAATQQH